MLTPNDERAREHPALRDLDTEEVEGRSFPETPLSPAQVRARGWRADDLWLPAVVCDADALQHNLHRFAGWCADRGVDHAPHGKTTMAPRLWAAQLAAGAWALTAATVAQARTMRRFGVPRVVLATEVADPGELRWVAETTRDPGFELYCLVDSDAGLSALAAAVEAADGAGPLPVLVELGVAGRRTGVRGVGAAVQLAGRVAGTPTLRLAGVEGYEGVWPTRRDNAAQQDARGWLDQVVQLAVGCDAAGFFAGTDEVVLTAGGSAYVDLVVDAFTAAPALSRPARTLVRSGCYLSHDHLSYERSSPLRGDADPDPLRPALTCLARVLSSPEPGRSLLGVGKRDVAFDIDLPVPLHRQRDGEAAPLRGRASVVELNDHHGFVDHEPGLLAVGDVVELGLSHPCTVFDKWSLIPLVDARGQVVDAIRTVF
jgi:D-serine deaminase-like pyridoxal phosphate-dependent protein